MIGLTEKKLWTSHWASKTTALFHMWFHLLRFYIISIWLQSKECAA